MVVIWNTRVIKRILIGIFLASFLVVLCYQLIGQKNISKKYTKEASLSYKKRAFYLKDEPFQIMSGSIHYFRVPPERWKDCLLFLKSSGLNTVETVSPWNLHEERKGIYNFEGNLNLRKFVQLAHELGLYVILSPGPYVSGDIEFGGMPSWLLSDPNMKVRSVYVGFLNRVEEYLKQLLREINDLQHSNGGPIISFQIENEYSSFGNSVTYMHELRDVFVRSGVVESMFLSNSVSSIIKLNDIFFGINANTFNAIEKLIQSVHDADPEAPVFISGFWTGWFRLWGEGVTNVISDEDFKFAISTFLQKGYSFNLYMFHGGTNFGFINGGTNISQVPNFITTSYDYSAPLSESGKLNNKYFILRKALLNHLASTKNFKTIDIPTVDLSINYGDVELTHSMNLKQILEHVDNSVFHNSLKTMEELPINGNSGQSFGFILYQVEVNDFKEVTINAKVRDRGIFYYNENPITGNLRTSIVSSNINNLKMKLKDFNITNSFNGVKYLEILVENMGRLCYTKFQSRTFNEQRKGLTGDILVDNEIIKNWKMYPLEFKKSFMNKISSSSSWSKINSVKPGNYPKMFKGKFMLSEAPHNTFISMASWTKGVVFINGFNIGRYWNRGPSLTLFLPKSLLRFGENEIIVFELQQPGLNVRLQSNEVFLKGPSNVFA